MQLTFQGGTGRLHICDIEELAIGTTRIAGAHRLAHNRMRAVTAGDVGCITALFLAVSSAQTSDHVRASIAITEKFSLPLDQDAQVVQPRDQESLVLVLRKDLQGGIR